MGIARKMIASFGSVLLVLSLFLCSCNALSAEIRKNNKSFEEAVISIDEDADSIRLSDLTEFEWDELYYFSGYTSTEVIVKILGFESHVKPTEQDGRSNVIFTKDDKIVCCFVDGSNPKYYFDVGLSDVVFRSSEDILLILTRSGETLSLSVSDK